MYLHRRLACGPVFVAAFLWPDPQTGCQAAGSWSGGVTATSDYVMRGVSQSDGQSALQGTVSYGTTDGWYAGIWASTLEESADWYPAAGADSELDLFVGRRLPLNDAWSADLRAVRYLYASDGNLVDYDYTELEVAVSYEDLVRATIAWSPDASTVTRQGLMRDETALVYELVIGHTLLPWLSIAAGAGYRDLSGLETDGYGYWSLGLTALYGPLSLDLAYIDTDSEGDDLFGSHLAGARTVISLGLSF